MLALTGFLVPVGVFYGLRAADASVYVSLLVSAAVSAIPNLKDLLGCRPHWSHRVPVSDSVPVRRPLAYVTAARWPKVGWHWPTGWEHLSGGPPRFQRIWRVASLLWGIGGTLVDATARVLMAYTLPPDSVPALSTALYVVMSLVLFVGTNFYYAVSGVFDPRSEMRCVATRQ